jgi:16S rRNA (cytosine967-C5)-methyltransferase
VLPGPKSPGQDVQAALDVALADSTLDPRDRGLATELVYGYLRLCGRLDYILAQFLKNPAAVPLAVRRILGLAAYEILHCAKVPAYASVDWAVSAVRKAGGKGLSGMANAVLRRVAADPGAFGEPGFYRRDRPSEAVYLSPNPRPLGYGSTAPGPGPRPCSTPWPPCPGRSTPFFRPSPCPPARISPPPA